MLSRWQTWSLCNGTPKVGSHLDPNGFVTASLNEATKWRRNISIVKDCFFNGNIVNHLQVSMRHQKDAAASRPPADAVGLDVCTWTLYHHNCLAHSGVLACKPLLEFTPSLASEVVRFWSSFSKQPYLQKSSTARPTLSSPRISHTDYRKRSHQDTMNGSYTTNA